MNEMGAKTLNLQEVGRCSQEVEHPTSRDLHGVVLNLGHHVYDGRNWTFVTGGGYKSYIKEDLSSSLVDEDWFCNDMAPRHGIETVIHNRSMQPKFKPKSDEFILKDNGEEAIDTMEEAIEIGATKDVEDTTETADDKKLKDPKRKVSHHIHNGTKWVRQQVELHPLI